MLSTSPNKNVKTKFRKGVSLGDLIRMGVTQEEIKKRLGFKKIYK
ncbi:hypothetical protein [Flammeovirga sp. EKP202]|nr:hypothetical protein [Flammeovirga sp. EKP202]